MLNKKMLNKKICGVKNKIQTKIKTINPNRLGSGQSLILSENKKSKA